MSLLNALVVIFTVLASVVGALGFLLYTEEQDLIRKRLDSWWDHLESVHFRTLGREEVRWSLAAFDHLFGRKMLSWRRVGSCTAVVILANLIATLVPQQVSYPTFAVANGFTYEVASSDTGIVATIIAAHFIPSMLSLWFTRFLLASSVASFVGVRFETFWLLAVLLAGAAISVGAMYLIPVYIVPHVALLFGAITHPVLPFRVAFSAWFNEVVAFRSQDFLYIIPGPTDVVVGPSGKPIPEPMVAVVIRKVPTAFLAGHILSVAFGATRILFACAFVSLWLIATLGLSLSKRVLFHVSTSKIGVFGAVAAAFGSAAAFAKLLQSL